MNKLSKKQLEKIRKQPVDFGMLSDVADAILDGMQTMIDKLDAKIDGVRDSLDAKIDFVHSDLKHEIDNLKYDTPTMKEFNDLKRKVDVLSP